MLTQRFFPVVILICLTCTGEIKGDSGFTGMEGNSYKCENIDTAEVLSLIRKAGDLKFREVRKSLELASMGRLISEKLNFRKGISECDLILGEIYQSVANYEKALGYYLSALREYENLRNTGGIATASNNTGKIYELTGQYDLALTYYNQSLKLNKSIGNVNHIADNYTNIGQVYVLRDSVDKGLSHFLVAYLIADSLDDTQQMIVLLNSIGNGFLKIKKYHDALSFFETQYRLAEKEKNSFSLSGSLFNQGNAYFLSGDYVTALKKISESIKIAEQFNYLSILRNGEYLLSQIYANVGNYHTAFIHQNRYKTYSDSIFNKEKSKQLAEAQVKYELEGKEQEIQSLKQKDLENRRKISSKNTIILVSSLLSIVFISLVCLLFMTNRKAKALNRKLTEQGDELRLLNQQKDRFFSFVVHNLKNPFHTVWGFSELMLKYASEKNMEKLVRYSKYIFDSSYGIKQILDNLQEWTRIQHGNYEYNPQLIELESLIKDTLELNGRIAAEKNISLSCDNVSNRYAIADRQSVYTILQNLISNAINFTPSLGNVRVSARYSGRFLEITVSDTGAGLSEEDIQQLFKIDVSPSLVGIKNTKGAGMGLILCKELVSKNGGEIRVESSPGGGSKFIFTLPLPENEVEYSEANEKGLDDFITEVKTGLKNEKNLPGEFLKEMNRLLPAYEYLSKAISVEELKDFSQSIIRQSEIHHVESLTLYGKKLFTYAEKLQFDKILRILPEFPDLIKETEEKKG